MEKASILVLIFEQTWVQIMTSVLTFEQTWVWILALALSYMTIIPLSLYFLIHKMDVIMKICGIHIKCLTYVTHSQKMAAIFVQGTSTWFSPDRNPLEETLLQNVRFDKVTSKFPSEIAKIERNEIKGSLFLFILTYITDPNARKFLFWIAKRHCSLPPSVLLSIFVTKLSGQIWAGLRAWAGVRWLARPGSWDQRRLPPSHLSTYLAASKLLPVTTVCRSQREQRRKWRRTPQFCRKFWRKVEAQCRCFFPTSQTLQQDWNNRGVSLLSQEGSWEKTLSWIQPSR